ncbi:MAG: ATP-grasp domain-containing protein [Patescibacteria group bacterium]|nr:ATP-grasp domain-containing protein [Patescibacteria group bacterium]
MKKTIVLLYNQRHVYPDPNDYRNQIEADFDDPQTTSWQIKHLKNLGFNVIPIEANEKAYFKLYRLRKKIDLVFNVSEGIYGLDREAQMPAILEMLQIPYLGSSPLTQAIVLDKAKTKEILIAYNISTLSFQIFKNENEKLNRKLKFPLIVKPLAQGSSAGITNESVVFNEKKLKCQIKKIINAFNQPVLVESFLKGREFSVAMIGNPPEILPIIEPNHKILPKNYLPFDSLEVKWYLEENEKFKNYLQCPAKISKKLEKKIKNICFNTWKALNIRDWCRIDIKCDEFENPYVLEVNSPPGIIPPEVSMTSYFPLAARAKNINYEELLKKLIEVAFKRYKK